MDMKIKINGRKSTWDIERPILTKGHANKKIAKSEKFQGGKYSTMILHLAPGKISGYCTCPYASPGCLGICLNKAGQGGMFKSAGLHTSSIHIARSGRTTLLNTKMGLFFRKLKNELDSFLIKCDMKGSIPCIRLNGTSDLDWMRIADPDTGKSLMELYPEIQFYDYTKDMNQLNDLPDNYYITFSRSETNELDTIKAMDLGFNIAVVFDKKIGIPETYKGIPVFNADDTDLRFLDNKLSGFNHPIIIGLLEKGYLAMRDKTGFVVRSLENVKAVA